MMIVRMIEFGNHMMKIFILNLSDEEEETPYTNLICVYDIFLVLRDVPEGICIKQARYVFYQ